MQPSFPYGVWFPVRSVRQGINVTPQGEAYPDYPLLEDEYLDSGGQLSVAEFSCDSIAGGDASLLDLMDENTHGLGAREALLVVLGMGKFGVLTLDDILHVPEAKACWLALVLELERAALELLKLKCAERSQSCPSLA